MKTYSEIIGDGGSGVLEQVIAQRSAVNERLKTCGQLLLIGSGKGGVGKSSVTVQLALALRLAGYRVGVLDADLNGPSIARMMGTRREVFIPQTDSVKVPRTCDDIAVLSLGGIIPEEEHLEFPALTTSDTFTWRAIKEFTSLAEILSVSDWGTLDLLLVDLPPGPERTAQFADFFGPEALSVMVTIPTALSHGVVARSISALRRTRSRILGYVENMSGYYCPRCNDLSPLFVRSEDSPLGCECLGHIAFDPEFARLADSGIHIEDWKKLASRGGAERIVKRIDEELRGVKDEISLRKM